MADSTKLIELSMIESGKLSSFRREAINCLSVVEGAGGGGGGGLLPPPGGGVIIGAPVPPIPTGTVGIEDVNATGVGRGPAGREAIERIVSSTDRGAGAALGAGVGVALGATFTPAITPAAKPPRGPDAEGFFGLVAIT
jgi:hypothetical protein